jgi:colicin import membrane protein
VTAARDDFRPRRPAGMSKGALLAIAAHALLILALALGLRWRTSTPEVVTAELWSATPQQAAPPPPVPVQPPPPPPPPPEPEVKPAPPPPPPQAQPDAREAEIALERQREAARRTEEERLQREKRELARQEREREERERAQRERQERERQEAAERRERERREQQARQEAEDKKKREAEAKRQEQLAEQRLARQRDEQLARLQRQIGDGSSPTATASRAASISTEYAGRIAARIKPHIVFADDVPGNPAALVEVGVSPSGKIIARKLLKSSGHPAWDDAVLRAIDRTDVLPRDVDGRVPPLMELRFRPNE